MLTNLHQNEGNGKNMIWFGKISVFVPCEPVFFSLWFRQASRQDISSASPWNILDGDHSRCIWSVQPDKIRLFCAISFISDLTSLGCSIHCITGTST